MASIPKITVKVRAAWWLRWYLYGVKWFALAYGLQPNWSKVEAWIARGISAKVIK